MPVEVRAFGNLYFLFKERGWDIPKMIALTRPITADQLRQELQLPAAEVEVVFINHLARPLSTPIHDGDRVAFVPPGIPTIHRFLMGFYDTKV